MQNFRTLGLIIKKVRDLFTLTHKCWNIIQCGEQNKNDSWPEPQSISEGNIFLVNSTNDSIILGKDVKKIKVRGTTEVKPPDINQTFYKYKPDLKKINGEGDDNIKLIVQSKKITEEAKK